MQSELKTAREEIKDIQDEKTTLRQIWRQLTFKTVTVDEL